MIGTIEDMFNSPRNPLPQGVQGLALGDAVFVVANDKFVLTSKGTREHITMHLGPNSQVFDVHTTSIATDGASSHIPLFSITHANLATMMQELARPIAETLIGLAQPLDLEWMAKRRIGAIVGILPTGADISAVTRVRRRKLIVDERKLVAQAWAPEFLHDLYDLNEGALFTLFSCPRGRKLRKIGYGFPVTDTRRHRRLIWVPDKRVAEAIERVGAILQDAAARYGSLHTPAAELAWKPPPNRLMQRTASK